MHSEKMEEEEDESVTVFDGDCRNASHDKREGINITHARSVQYGGSDIHMQRVVGVSNLPTWATVANIHSKSSFIVSRQLYNIPRECKPAIQERLSSESVVL